MLTQKKETALNKQTLHQRKSKDIHEHYLSHYHYSQKSSGTYILVNPFHTYTHMLWQETEY